MSTLVVNYGEINYFNSTASSLARKFQSRIDDYKGVIKGVNSLPTSRDNLESSNYFIRKKNEQNEAKINKINAFKTRVSNFVEEAKETDKQVASRITQDTKTFKKANDIKVNPLVVIGSAIKTYYFPWTKTLVGRQVESWIKDKVRDTKYAIKDWYRKDGNRFLVKIIKGAAVVAIIATVVAVTILSGGSALALLGATATAKFFTCFALFSAACSFGYDIAAYNKYKKTGNISSARWLDKKGGDDVLSAGAGGVGYAIGHLIGEEELANKYKKIGQGIGKVAFSVLTLASIGHGFVKMGSSGFQFAKDFSKIKKMGMLQGKSNLKVLWKTVKKKAISKDLKIGFGALDIKYEFSVTKYIFGKNTTNKKVIFNIATDNAKRLYKELSGKGVADTVEDNISKTKKEAVRIKDLMKDIKIPPRKPSKMPEIVLTNSRLAW